MDHVFPLEEHAPEFDRLAQHLVRVSPNRSVLFCASPGNWGDSIINAGSRNFLHRYGFSFVEVSRTQLLEQGDLSDKHVVVGGGGGWCKFWHTTPELVDQLSLRAGYVTVLPTTFGVPPKTPRLGSNVKLFARDEGYSMSNRADAVFCHDMAFHHIPALRISPEADGELVALRVDRESRSGGDLSSVPKGNVDISLDGDGFRDAASLYARLSAFRSVVTDRLHVGIASAQLGLQVELLPSAYPKVENVFASSMSGYFPNVRMSQERRV